MQKAIENIQPILYVTDMKASINYYEQVLGFEKAEWRLTHSPPSAVTTGGFTFVKAPGTARYMGVRGTRC